MAIGDLYKAVPRISVFGEICENAFWYFEISNDASGDGGAAGLAVALTVNYLAELFPNLSEDAGTVEVEVWNYTNIADYYLNPYVNPGEVASESAPSQWCYGVKMGRPGVGWNYPRKRISGLPLFAYPNNGVDAGVAGLIGDIVDDCRSIYGDGSQYVWNVIRPATGFAVGNPVLRDARPVGALIGVYDASQATRRN